MADFVEVERVVEKKENPLHKFLRKTKADIARAKVETPKRLRDIFKRHRGKTDGPGALTPQQMAKLRKSFDLFDEDGSGGIDAREMTKCLASLGHTLTREQCTNIFNCIDHDGNGSIDFDEFVDIMQTQRRHEAWLVHVQRAFDDAVKAKPDEIHTLTSAELRAILVANADEEHTGDQIDRLAALADADGDGSVDHDEFLAIMKTNKRISDIFPCSF